MIKRLSWHLTLGGAAALVGGVLAPQVLIFTHGLLELLPDWLVGAPSVRSVGVLAAYECTLWGTGLAFWLLGQRFGWLRGMVSAGVQTATPVAAEIIFLGMVGLAAPPSAVWVTTRLSVGSAAIGLALYSAAKRRRATPRD